MRERHRAVSLIGVPTDVGAGCRGASMGPEALRVAGIAHMLEGQGVAVRDCGNLNGPLNPDAPPAGGFRHFDEVLQWNRLLHAAVYAELADGRVPVMLGCYPRLGLGLIRQVARYSRAPGVRKGFMWGKGGV